MGKSRIGSSTFISSKIEAEKELWGWKSERISEKICPSGECNYSYLQILLTLIPLKMRIKDFMICHDKIYLFGKYFLALATFGVELDI